MSDDVKKNTPAIYTDGFDGETDEDRSGIMRGRKTKFDDGWTCRGEPISPDREFIALETLKALQKWVPGRKGPAETIIIDAGQPWPDVDAMNEECHRSEWQDKFGKLVGPWQKVRALYFIDQQTGQVYSYIASTIGGMRAVRDLREATRHARKLRGAPVLAVFTLGECYMPTQYGGRQRGDFKILRYEAMGGQEPGQLALAGPDDGKPKQGDGGALADMTAPQPPKASKQSRKSSAKQTSLIDLEDDVPEEEDEDAPFFELGEDEPERKPAHQGKKHR
jgi:hypothetical protein